MQVDVRITARFPMGTVTATPGEPIPFCGWLGLLAAIAAVVDEGEDNRCAEDRFEGS